jgi:hypothetical protein
MTKLLMVFLILNEAEAIATLIRSPIRVDRPRAELKLVLKRQAQPWRGRRMSACPWFRHDVPFLERAQIAIHAIIQPAQRHFLTESNRTPPPSRTAGTSLFVVTPT